MGQKVTQRFHTPWKHCGLVRAKGAHQWEVMSGVNSSSTSVRSYEFDSSTVKSKVTFSKSF